MKMTGEQSVAARRQRAWEALNDPEVLKQCIPGCQSLERESEDRFKAVVAIKIGPIGARFTGAVSLTEIDAPNAYVLVGEGQGGAAGFAKGSARVRLAENGGSTLLSYEVDAQVGGRMAQLGGAVLDATAKQLAGNFFKRFGEIVAAPEALQAAPEPALAGAATAPVPPPRPARAAQGKALQGVPMAWILALAVASMGGFLLGRAHGGDAMSDWAGLAIGLLVVVAAAAGFEFGRRAAAPVLVVDPALLERLIARPPGGEA